VSRRSEVLGVLEMYMTSAINRSSADQSPIESVLFVRPTLLMVLWLSNDVSDFCEIKLVDERRAPHCILLLAAHTRRIIRDEKTAD
jgi:hypothetical protein